MGQTMSNAPKKDPGNAEPYETPVMEIILFSPENDIITNSCSELDGCGGIDD